MAPHIFRKAAFIGSMIIIIVTHPGCKKDACEDCPINTDPPPVTISEWTRLQSLPKAEFSSTLGDWFNDEGFLMGIENNVFAISNIGKVWRYNGITNSWSF